MFCTNCGKTIPDGSVFCPECGATLDTAPAAPAAPAIAKKGLSKGLLIGIIAAVAAIAALVLILVLTSPKHKLVGTWSVKEEMYGQTMEMKMIFKAGGKGEIKYVYNGEEGDESVKFKWKVGSKNKLTIIRLDEDGDEIDSSKTTMKYDKSKAKKNDDYWFIDGKTLYMGGEKYKKK